jgi:hypothetical protein
VNQNNVNQALLAGRKEAGLQLDAEKAKYMVMSRSEVIGQKNSIKIANRCFENVANSNTSEQI